MHVAAESIFFRLGDRSQSEYALAEKTLAGASSLHGQSAEIYTADMRTGLKSSVANQHLE